MWRRLGIGLVMAGLLPLGGCAQGSVQEALGMDKRAPDEFAVVKRAPLIVPPDFELRPPEPGAPRPNVGRTSDQARVALTGSQAEQSPTAELLTRGTPVGAPGPGASTPGSVPASAIADDLMAAGTNMPPTSAAAGATPPAASAIDGARPALDPGVTRGELAMVALAGGDQADPDIRRTIAEENQALADVEASLFTRIVKWRDPSTLGATIDAPAEAQRLRDNEIAGRPPTAGDTPTVVNRRQSALQGLLEDIF